MSIVFYRWGAGRNENRVTFDGTHISVFDLKREIILQSKMGNGRDFDLAIYDSQSNEEFKDDNQQIPRSSSLIARRLPATAKGRGSAYNYIIGTDAALGALNEHRMDAGAKEEARAKMLAKGARGAAGTFGSMSKRFDGKEEKRGEPSVPISTGDADEDARIQAMLKQGAETWEAMADDMSLQARPAREFRKPPPKSTAGGAGAGKFDYGMPSDKEPPPGYICYRCGQKGHWIHDCPNSNDTAGAQDKKRFVRVTGIPRSFLKHVETPIEGEGSSGGAMLTADGGFVRAVPDQAQFKKHVTAKTRGLTGQDVRDAEPLDAELTCPICKKLLWDAVRVPCCDTAFCEECITNTLLERAFECPSCESKVPSLDKLRPDEELRERVKGYVDGEVERSKKDEVKEEGEAVKEEKADSSTPQPGNGVNEAANAAPAPTVTARIPGLDLDPAQLEQMLLPQNMQIYTKTVHRMLQNPKIDPASRLLLSTQLEALQMAAVQAQMMRMMGMQQPGQMGGQMGMNGGGPGMMGGLNASGMPPMSNMDMGMMGMGGMPQMNMNMPNMGMMPGPGMGMNMGMGMGMNGGGMNGGGMGMMNSNGGGFRGRGRGGGGGGFRGGRGRGMAPGQGQMGRGMPGQQGMGMGMGMGAGIKRPADEDMGPIDKSQRVA